MRETEEETQRIRDGERVPVMKVNRENKRDRRTQGEQDKIETKGKRKRKKET